MVVDLTIISRGLVVRRKPNLHAPRSSTDDQLRSRRLLEQLMMCDVRVERCRHDPRCG